MESLKGVCNSIYLFVRTGLDKEISRREQSINAAVENVFNGQSADVDSWTRRAKMKVKIIKEYDGLSSIDDKDRRMSLAVEKIQKNTTQKLGIMQALKLIPSNPIIKKHDPIFETKKAVYIQNLEISDASKDKKIKSYFNNSEVQKLASEIESDMEKNIGLNDLAKLMTSKYQKTILTSFPGIEAGEMVEIYLAILLLQKGDKFSSAIQTMNEYIDDFSKKNPKDYPTLGPVDAEISSIMAGIGAIKESDLIPDTVITKKSIPDFQSQKEKSLENLNNSTNPVNDELKKYLKNKEIQKLAIEIESDMEKDTTLKELSELITSKYRNTILTFFPGKKAIGGDELTEVYLAILLLQKGDKFPSAIQSLDEYINKCNQATGKELGFIHASLQPPLIATGAIQQGLL